MGVLFAVVPSQVTLTLAMKCGKLWPSTLPCSVWGSGMRGTSLHLAAGGSSQPRRAQHSWLWAR